MLLFMPAKLPAKRKRAQRVNPSPPIPQTGSNGESPARTVGQNIAQHRNAKGWTQLGLAHAIGYQGPDAGSAVSRMESGSQQPRLSTLARLAEALGVSVGALIKK